MNKNCLSICQGYSIMSERILLSSTFTSLLLPTAKCFSLYLEKVQDFAEREGCGEEQRELALVLPGRHQKQC